MKRRAIGMWFIGLSLLSSGVIRAQQPKELRLGIFPNITHTAGLVGIERKLIQQELGDYKLIAKYYANGSQINDAFKAGDIDAAYVGPGPAMNAFLQGQPIRIYAGAANAGAVLVRRYGSGVSRVEELAGKKVAVPTRGSTQDISLRHMLHQVGLKASDEGGNVTIVPINPADMPEAFQKGTVDAALVQEPWGAYMENRGAKLLANERQIWEGGNYTSTVLVVDTKYAAQNPEALKGLLRGHLQAVNYTQKSLPASFQAVSSQITQITGKKPTLNELLKGLARTRIVWDINLKTLEEYGALNKEAGFAKELPDLTKLVDLSMVRELSKELKR